MAYHLKDAHDGVRTSLLDRCTERNVLCATVHQRMAWTDVGSVGVVGRLDLGESVAFSQISCHGGVSQVCYLFFRSCSNDFD